jgi:hypothetical protein
VNKQETTSIPTHHLSIEDSLKARVDSLLKKSVPLMGYRFQLTGDFNGDGKWDTLVEHYTDSLRTKEVAKYDEAFDYFDSWFIADQLNKQSFLSANDSSLLKLEGGILGFIYIENCRDVTGDGVDDLFVVPHRGGASNCVSGYIYSLKNKEWKSSSVIHVWQWQFPDTPDAAMSHGLMGSYDVNYTHNDSINHLLEDQLKDYRFIKRNKDQSIEYECRNPFDRDEFDSISKLYGQQELILKRFKPMMLDKKLYLQDRKYPNTFYGNITKQKEGKDWIYIFPFDDYAEMFTVRVYYKKNRMRTEARG